jgi:hypothetical protein
MESAWGSLISQLGLPTAMLIIFVICIIKEYLISGVAHRREIENLNEHYKERISDKNAVIKDLIYQRDVLIKIASTESHTANMLLPIAERGVTP